MAQDLCILNTAGPEKRQAVALRISADATVVYRCRINAYQDTLCCSVSCRWEWIYGSRFVHSKHSRAREAAAVDGSGFMAQDLCILNTAGPEKRQTVALHISADATVVYRCRINAYQDTLCCSVS
ncbi:unnamed protein product [Arabidopsis thaliana]|uniref:(thale cress) hypothetical protein n=1 Tax=Arabidopsis thaliana TaxID=3702 RepID=A0A7G2EPQ2_ARATH|nr:unnamed protein product [Arabidopsis thaliana]